jgi:ATP-dependent Lon protease
MCTALISVFTGIPVRSDTAMTGEITLHGQVTKIGGLKEKLLAAKRGGIKRVIIPEDNAADLREIPSQITHALEILPIRWVDEAITHALTSEPKPLTKKGTGKNINKTKSSNIRSSSRNPH